MIALDALPPLSEPCATCGGKLIAQGWIIPGMRSLTRAYCAQCSRTCYVDLPVGQALYSPMVLDADSGQVKDRTGVGWFADWLRDGYARRTTTMPTFAVERRHPVARPVVLLNCLDVMYGHCLLKLLSAQRYLDGRHDVIVLTQPFLRDLVPSDAAELWIVDLPLREGTRWSDALADRIAQEVARVGSVHLAPLPSHPHPTTFAIERFSGVRPFALASWRDTRPAVTFVWRDDRSWTGGGTGWRWRPAQAGPAEQAVAVAAFFGTLQRLLPDLDAAVAGVGMAAPLPGWITDLRTATPDAERDRQWLDRYARSHLVIGVHGSNMLLPTAHAGGAIEMIGRERAGNVLQDMLFNGDDARDLMFRYRFVSPDITPDELAQLSAEIIARYPDFDRLMEHRAAEEMHDVRH